MQRRIALPYPSLPLAPPPKLRGGQGVNLDKSLRSVAYGPVSACANTVETANLYYVRRTLGGTPLSEGIHSVVLYVPKKNRGGKLSKGRRCNRVNPGSRCCGCAIFAKPISWATRRCRRSMGWTWTSTWASS